MGNVKYLASLVIMRVLFDIEIFKTQINHIGTNMFTIVCMNNFILNKRSLPEAIQPVAGVPWQPGAHSLFQFPAHLLVSSGIYTCCHTSVNFVLKPQVFGNGGFQVRNLTD